MADRRVMPARHVALKLVEEGHSYEEAGLLLGVLPGLVYLAATVSADAQPEAPASQRSAAVRDFRTANHDAAGPGTSQ